MNVECKLRFGLYCPGAGGCCAILDSSVFLKEIGGK